MGRLESRRKSINDLMDLRADPGGRDPSKKRVVSSGKTSLAISLQIRSERPSCGHNSLDTYKLFTVTNGRKCLQGLKYFGKRVTPGRRGAQ